MYTVCLKITPSVSNFSLPLQIRRRKRKPTPPRCARQPLSREGARVDTPSFLWKEVPRRGGGWMEGSGMKESEGDRLKYAVCESTLSTAANIYDAMPEGLWKADFPFTLF